MKNIGMFIFKTIFKLRVHNYDNSFTYAANSISY